MASIREQALRFWRAGVDEVNGRRLVRAKLSSTNADTPDFILSVGKAAGDMALGAIDIYGDACPVLVVTKYDHLVDELASRRHVDAFEAGHPLPDEQSLRAGRRVLDAVSALPADASLLILLSGGASALVEVLPDGMSLGDLEKRTVQMLRQDMPINEINVQRAAHSCIKGGRLLEAFPGRDVRSLILSDVPGDDPSLVGSGLAHHPDYPKPEIVGTNKTARDAAAAAAQAAGFIVRENAAHLDGEIEALAARLAHALEAGESGVFVWGGEPTVALPPNPGRGGRNQALALLLAKHIEGRDDIALVVGGTDGTDGPTNAAGGIVDGGTFARAPEPDRALANADAGTALEEAGDLLVTGPTGTNVMDLVVAIKR